MATGHPGLKFLSPTQKQTVDRNRLMVIGALAALQAAERTGMGGVPAAPVLPPTPPAPTMGVTTGNGSPPSMAAPAMGAAPPVTPPLQAPPLLQGGVGGFAAGGVVAPQPASPASPPAAVPAVQPQRPMVEEPEMLEPYVVPAHKLFEFSAKRLRPNPMGTTAAPVGTGAPPSSRLAEDSDDFDYLIAAMDAPPPPAAFLSWARTANPNALTGTARLLAEAFRADPNAAPLIWQAAQDIAEESPAELPEEIRQLARGR